MMMMMVALTKKIKRLVGCDWLRRWKTVSEIRWQTLVWPGPKGRDGEAGKSKTMTATRGLPVKGRPRFVI